MDVIIKFYLLTKNNQHKRLFFTAFLTCPTMLLGTLMDVIKKFLIIQKIITIKFIFYA